MNRIIIGNEDLDLYNKDEITFNLSINTIGDISRRNSSYSNTIKIPKTIKNQRIFKFLGVMGNISNVPYTIKNCKYLRDTTLIIKDGYLRVLETTKDEYVVVIFDGIIDLNDTLDGLELNALAFDDVNHYFTQENFENSFSNTSGYIYGIMDYGNPFDGFVQIANQAPSIYAHTLWDKIFTGANITYSGSFFSTNTDWKNYVVTPKLGFTTFASIISTSFHGTFTTPDTPDYTEIYEDRNDQGEWSYNEAIIHPNGNIIGQPEYTKNTLGVSFTANFTGLAELVVNLEYRNRFTDSLTYKILSTEGGTIHTEILDAYTDAENTDDKTRQITIQRQVVTGETFFFAIAGDARKVPALNNTWAFQVDYHSALTLRKIVSTGDSYFVDFKDIIGDTKQTDFVKDMMQRYGLVFRRTGTNAYEFKQISELLTDRENAVDYTDKLIGINSEKYDSGYSQRNLLKHSYPSTTSFYNYDGILEVNDKNLDIETTIITSQFEIPEQTDDFMGREIFQSNIWNPDKKNSQNIAYENKDSKIKYMNVNNGSTSFDFKYFTGAEYTLTGPVPTLSLENVSYQYFVDNYYEEFGWLLDNYREVEVEMNLTNIDITKIDFFKLVFLQQTGRYYYIDSVRTGESTTMTLIEITRFS